MMPHCKRDTQFELFETLNPAERTAPLALPIQRSAEIDTQRVAKILDISHSAAKRMARQKLLRAYKLSDASAWRIEYASVVEYCDQICLHYCIPRQRASVLPKGRRHRDADILPFPLDETIGVQEVRAALDCNDLIVSNLIEEGKLVAYKIFPKMRACPWRIHAPSLGRHIASLHEMATSKTAARHRSPHGALSL
jgi:hypothetical protein